VAIGAAHAPGATPLDPDEAAGIIPAGVSTLAELNAYESENILRALDWIDGQRNKDVLDDSFLRELHRRMFDRTWKWSGTYRLTEKNIGIDPSAIAVAVRNLTLDCRTQLDARSPNIDEIAARFYHRLTQIDPFPNGNGRQARLAADLLLRQCAKEPFTWGAKHLAAIGPLREAYLEALREADKRNMAPLLSFVRT